VSARGLITLGDYGRAAAVRVRGDVMDFVDGGAGPETTLRANTAAFGRWRLRPRVLVDVSHLDTAVTVFRGPWRVPIGVAPTALNTLVCPEGELATARAAEVAGVPMIVSTFASRTIEDIAAAAPAADLWQQVYLFRDLKVTRSLVERAEAAGATAIVVTVDSPWMGRRHRNLRNDFRMPTTVTAANLAASLPAAPDISSPEQHAAQTMDPSLTWADISDLTEWTDLPIVIKGILTGDDARIAHEAGAAAIIVSNHGARQLDQVPATLDVLPEIVTALPRDIPVLMDGGIRSGIDVLIALALGATAVLIGRPVLHGLAVGGQAGVEGVLSLLSDELRDAMGHTGRPTLATVDTSLLAPPPPPVHAPWGSW
jgi:isopentenyl diphosphate isomerase/L-lactate dehydrogenase-like FMN-dependent dehydrogenase